MSADECRAVEWDGDQLVGWVDFGGTNLKVAADRDTIHRHAAGFSDALSWEIARHSIEIFEKLRSHLLQRHGRDGPQAGDADLR